MSDEQLRALERRFKETGSAADERAFLAARVRVVPPANLEVAARFGSKAAAVALDLPVAEAPKIYGMRWLEGARESLFGASDAALHYHLGVAQDVLDAWRARGPKYGETVDELSGTARVIRAYLDGRRSDEDSRDALAWAWSGSARAELVQGRFEGSGAGRGLWHLAFALSALAYVCSPLDAPSRKGATGPPRHADGGRRLGDDEIRLARVLSAQHQVFESIKGHMYMDRPRLSMTDTDYGDVISAVTRPYEERAAQALVRWLLTSDVRLGD